MSYLSGSAVAMPYMPQIDEKYARHFAAKPNKKSLVELWKMVRRKRELYDNFHKMEPQSDEEKVQKDIDAREIERECNDAANVYALALDLYMMSNTEFTRWQYVNNITPRDRQGVKVESQTIDWDKELENATQELLPAK